MPFSGGGPEEGIDVEKLDERLKPMRQRLYEGESSASSRCWTQKSLPVGTP